MATVYKVLGQSYPSAQTATTLYTVPAANSTVVSTINICNLSQSNGTFRIAVRPGGAALANAQYLAYDTPIPASDSIAMTMGVTLGNTDVVTVYTVSGNISFSLFGSEIY
jgi:hypothetical protein